MRSHALRIALYRFRSSFRDRLASYVALVLFVAILGGVAMATVAGARRTETSFATLLNRYDSSQLVVPLQVYNPQAGFTSGYSAATVDQVRQLAHVKDVEAVVGLNAFPLGRNGHTVPGDNGFAPNGSVDGMELNHQDGLIIAKGRLPNPRRADEFVADSGSVREFGWHLGQTVTFAYYTNKASVAAADTGPKVAGHFKVKLVGVGAVQPGNLVQDQVDNVDLQLVLFTPALTRRYLSCCANDTIVGIQTNDGSRSESAVAKEFQRRFPAIGAAPQTESIIEQRVARSVTPEAVALGVFGLITALAALAIAAQLISRNVRRMGSDARVLRAMGADPRSTLVDGLVGVTISIFVGSLLAGALAVVLSPLAPIGPIRPYLGAHFNADWTVLGVGLAFLLLALCCIATVTVHRNQPHRDQRLRRPYRPGLGISRVAGNAGLPVAAVTGVGFALDSGGARRAIPMRSAILGAAVALVIVGATTTFASSLRTLVSNPPLYGWNWDVAINGGGGVGDIPTAIFGPLKKDRDIASTSNAYFASLHIDGQSIPVMGEDPGATIQPPLLAGHGLRSADEIVLGSSTLQRLHKAIGDTVVVSSSRTKKTTLTIVGTATMPAFGPSGENHLEMGIGAVLNYKLIPLFERDVFDLPPGPNAILVRYRKGVTKEEGKKSILHAVEIVSHGSAPGNLLQGVQRPAEIVDYRSLGSTPIELGAVLCGGALVALGLTLLSSVRRRRRDIALLKALGFSRRQVGVTIAVQSTIAVGLGALIGIPVGIVVGRALWSFFAGTIHAVPRVVVPTYTLLIIAGIALVMANLIAALPARIAARTSPAILLRAE